MGFWIQIRWLGKGLQIASAIVGGGISLVALETADTWIRTFVTALLWALAIGMLFELWYDIHELKEEMKKRRAK
jgi:hypothetical protein